MCKTKVSMPSSVSSAAQPDWPGPQTGRQPGNASYYYSQTRLLTKGKLQIDEEIFAVNGFSWKDHEYSTSALSTDQVGWDWFSIQLADGYELMLYQIRRTDGS